jgi:hypothetical protein
MNTSSIPLKGKEPPSPRRNRHITIKHKKLRRNRIMLMVHPTSLRLLSSLTPLSKSLSLTKKLLIPNPQIQKTLICFTHPLNRLKERCKIALAPLVNKTLNKIQLQRRRKITGLWP